MSDEQPWYTSVPELRAEVVKQQRRANVKISYNRRQKGIEIGGTGFDPRIAADNIKSMNKRQLTSYMRKLKAFTDRGNSFVAADGGAPIPSKLWAELEKVKTKYNEKAKRARELVDDIPLPRNGDMNIGQRRATLLPKNSVTSRGAVTTPNAEMEDIRPEDFTSAKAVEKMIENTKKKLSRKFDKQRIERGRDEARQMLDIAGASDLQEKLDKLSDKDFDLLWSYGGFAEDLSDWYEWFKLRAAGYKKDDLDAAVMDESKRAAIIQGLDWIEEIKKSRNQKS